MNSITLFSLQSHINCNTTMRMLKNEKACIICNFMIKLNIYWRGYYGSLYQNYFI